MTQVALISVVEQIKEEIQIDGEGRGKVSVRAASRLADVSDTALRKVFSSANLEPSSLAKKLVVQGFDAANLNSWLSHGIPDIAIAVILEYYAFEAGRYCTEQARIACKAFMAIGVRAWMQKIKNWHNPTPEEREEVVGQQVSAKEISEAIAAVFCFNTVDSNLIQGLIANQIGKAHPKLKSHMEAAKQLLAIPVLDELLTVTNLAKLYVKRSGEQLSKNGTEQGNAVEMNRMLIQFGLQVKNPSPTAKKDGQPLYLATELGKEHSKVVLQEANGNNRTVQQLRWFPSVINMIK